MNKDIPRPRFRLLVEGLDTESLRALEEELLTDAELRTKSLAEPGAVLRRRGVPLGDVQLSKRDKTILTLLSDVSSMCYTRRAAKASSRATSNTATASYCLKTLQRSR
jgi:hypothetical protein